MGYKLSPSGESRASREVGYPKYVLPVVALESVVYTVVSGLMLNHARHLGLFGEVLRDSLSILERKKMTSVGSP